MSDINISGIPNMGFQGGGGGYLGGIPNQQPAMSADQINASMWGRYSAPQAQSTVNNLYGPTGFGGQTAHYAGVGAAYGRATGGFGGGVPGGGGGYFYDDAAGLNSSTAPNGGGTPQFDPFTGAYTGMSAGGGGDTWSRGAPSSGVVGGWYDPYGGGGGYPMPQAGRAAPPVLSQDWQSTFNNTVHGNASDPYSMGDSSWYPSQRSYDYDDAAGLSPSTAQQGTPQFDPFTGGYMGMAHNPGTYAGDRGNYGIPYNGSAMPGDIGFSRQSPMPNLGYNPGMQNWFAPQSGGTTFQDRFGMGFPNAGTPSQYAPGAAMPPGFASPFSADNPRGALPLSGPYSADPFQISPGGG